MLRRLFDQIRYFFKGSDNRPSTADFEWEENHPHDDFGADSFYDLETRIRPGSYLLAYFVIGAVFIIIWLRLWSLQVVQGGYYRQLAEENRIRTKTTAAPRGLIYDRNRKLLVSNQPGYVLMVYPADLPQEERDRAKIYKKLKRLVNIKSELWQKIVKQHLFQLDPMVLKDNLTQKEALILKEKTVDMKGIIVEDQIKRHYQSSASLGHILGYIGKISQKELESLGYSDLSWADYVGKSGLEKSYDRQLRGKKGLKQVEVDSVGRIKRVLAERSFRAGNSLILSLDYDLQRVMDQSLARMLSRNGFKRGVAIASDPRTGEILGLVSLPGYDDNIFSSPRVNKEYTRLLNDENRPLFNRAISGLYPTGSVIKPIVAAAALQEKTITENTWINCKGEISVKNRYNPKIVYRFKDWKAHGPTNVIKAIAESCNVFFYYIGGGFDQIKGLGYEKLARYFKKFGLGQKTGIDLPLEEAGLIPSPEWKESTKGEVWYQGDTYHLAIGQGDLLASPLQVNNYISAIANGGNLIKPRLIKEIIGPDGRVIEKEKKEFLKRSLVSRSAVNIVKQGMRAAVTGGTSTPLNDLPVAAAAKTGTAQTPQGEGHEHAWFTAFAPYDNPKIVVTVMVENGGEGYQSALPVAKEILQYYFTR